MKTFLAALATAVAVAVAPAVAGAATITALDAPHVVLAGRPFDVVATVAAGDAALDATATVAAGGAVVGSAPVSAPAGGTAQVRIATTLPAAGRTSLAVAAGDAAGTAWTQAVDAAAAPGTADGPPLDGFGGQFNQNVYAAISRADGVSDGNVPAMEQAMADLHPQFSRIFFNPAALSDPDLMASFVRTVLLAQRTGTTINVTWQSGRLDVASGTVPKFADVLIDLVRNRHVTNLRWVTIQNEPNSTRIEPGRYELAYRALDPYIQSIRGQVRFMGGDLVADNQGEWFRYMAAHMADILDAYSIHVFWDYWDTAKLESRLTEVRRLVDSLPPEGRKPVYVAEYGVRGLRSWQGKALGEPGVWTDGRPLAETNVNAFQQAWFDVLAMRLGYSATSKWDLYFGRYDKARQAHSLVGDPRLGWPRHPLYNLLRLFTWSVQPGWHAVRLDAATDTSRLLAAFAGPDGGWTLVGLDRAGAQENGASPNLVPYAVGGLPPGSPLRLVVWNPDGSGLDSVPAPVWTDADGVATLSVPQQAVFVLTAAPGELWPRTAAMPVG